MEFQHEQGRIFALSDEGKLLCEVTFPVTGGVAELNHTFVDESLRGQGVAGKLMAAAVEEIRANGWKIRPTCSYAVSWLEKHAEHADLLV
ncbi:MAG: N-acetyltransferase [Oscillospiraceae bacterium]|nr:N-acetyltransferase [Oscillospiraceae bacterium]